MCGGAYTPSFVMLIGMCIAGYWPMSDLWFVLKAWRGVLAKFLGSFYDLCLPML